MKTLVVFSVFMALVLAPLAGCVTTQSPYGTSVSSIDIEAVNSLLQLGILLTPEVIELVNQINAAKLAKDQAESQQDALEQQAKIDFYTRLLDGAIAALRQPQE